MNESTPDRSDRILLRASDIGQWRDEVDKLQSQRNEIDDKIQQLNQKLAAAEFLAESDVPKRLIAGSVPIGNVQEVDTAGNIGVLMGDSTMPSAAEQIIVNARNTLAHLEIRSALRENPDFRHQLDQNPGYYYTIIGRLLKRKKIVKRGRKYGPPPKHENARDADHA